MNEMKILAIGTQEYEVMDAKSRPVSSVAEMKSLDNLVAGNIIKTVGYYEANDGGGALYLIRAKGETDVEDYGSIHFINDTLVAEMIIQERVLLSQFGLQNEVTHDTNSLNNALTYINNHKEIKLVIDKPYTFTKLDLTGKGYLTIEGINPKQRINIVESIIIPTHHNNFKDICFELQTDTTLLLLSGTYNTFTNCTFYGQNNKTGIGANISSYANTFMNCSIREFGQNLIILGNETHFIGCDIINGDNATEENMINVTINGGANICFNNCNIEKGYSSIKVTGGVVNFTNCYIEGAHSDYHIRLLGGKVNFEGNYMHNTYMAKYEACDLTLTNNQIEMSISTAYFLYCQEENIGYLVCVNNKMRNDNGLFTMANGNTVYYYQDGSWKTGIINKFLLLKQERCYIGGQRLTAWTAYFKKYGNESAKASEEAYHAPRNGELYASSDARKLLVYNGSAGWLDSLGNTPCGKKTGAPTNGTWKAGDIVWNSTPTTGGYIGWVCIEGGEPGTWKGFGLIAE